MKPQTPSSACAIVCGIALAAMSAAAASHWWSVRQFVIAVNSGLPAAAPTPATTPAANPAAPARPTAPSTKPSGTLAARTPQHPDPALAASAGQKEFYDALIRRIENLQNQNRDLLDQMAETNRDLMKLEFRVDTHSEQFRPLPVNEERIDTSFDMDPGVLPPRAEPVSLPSYE